MDDLVKILYEKGYFNFEDYALNYVDELYLDIQENLPKRPHKRAPEYFNKYGEGLFYASFQKNKQTTWYAFFTKYNDNGNTIFLVRYIANNHTIAQYL
jgi:hypothetical protein